MRRRILKHVKLIGLILLVSMLVSVTSTPYAFAWGPVTHYYINREVGAPVSGLWNKQVFNANGIGPDMFLGWGAFVDYAHAPSPKSGWRGKPNFAYLMWKINGKGDTYSENYIASMGWGAHIAADWVAHDDELFKIIDDPTDPLFWYHVGGEAAYDYYVFLRHFGATPVTSFEFKPNLIWKAMVNYELMELYETHHGDPYWTDEKLKATALANAPTESEIQGLTSKLTAWVYAEQAGLAWRLSSHPYELLFPPTPNGAETNLSLAINQAGSWIRGPSAYDGIPPISPITYNPLAFNMLDNQGNPGIAYAAEVPQTVQTGTGNTPDEIRASFWGKVAERAQALGALQVSQQATLDAWGEPTLKVTASVSNQEGFRTAINQVIEENIQTPASTADLKMSLFEKKFIVEAQTDNNILLDFTPPTITNLVPADGALAEGTTPTMSANVQDLPDGMGLSGVEPSSIVLTLDGVPVSHTYAPELNLVSYVPASSLSSGTHQVSLKVEDKAHNRTVKNWSFVIDPYPPETTATLSPPSPNGLNNWYVSDVTVSLSATDNPGGSGVDKTEYSLDNGATWQTYTAPFTVTSEGETKILYRSQDKVGNIEQPKEISFKIDKTPPNPPLILLPQDNSFLVNPIAVSGQAEALSSVTILSDGMPVLTASAGIGGNWQAQMTLPEGPHSLTATSTDEAGNKSLSSLPTSVLVRYATTLSFNPDCQRTGQYSDSVSLTATLSSNLGPVPSKTISFTLGSQEVQASTDSNGVATATVTLSQPASLYDLKATFAGDNTYKESTVSQPFIIEKEDNDLIYTGDALSSIVGSPAFTARLTDKDSGAPIPGREVIFSLGSQSVTSTTDQDGIATAFLVLNQPQGIYTLQASFLGDGYYLSSSSLPSYFVIYDPFTGEKATGGGWIERGLAKANFGFNAEYKYGESLPTGELQYKDHGTGLNIHSASFSWLIFQGSSATLTGLATANGVGGYSFRLEVSDLAEPGKGQDFFRLTLYNSNGEVFYSSEGILTQGNIKLH